MLAVEIKGLSCGTFRVAKGAAVPVQYLFAHVPTAQRRRGRKRKGPSGIRGQQQYGAPGPVDVRRSRVCGIDQRGRVIVGGDCTGLAA